jgi:hypothetical protein
MDITMTIISSDFSARVGPHCLGTSFGVDHVRGGEALERDVGAETGASGI